jgi:Bacteriophage Lambda NinG protein
MERVRRVKRKKRRPSNSLSVMRKRLDKAFKAMIRARDSGIRCISCEERPIEHAGHFVRSRHEATRWHWQNVNGQCVYCNTFLDGNEWNHGMGIEHKFGQGTAEKLQGMKWQSWSWEKHEIAELLTAVACGYDEYVVTYDTLLQRKLQS